MDADALARVFEPYFSTKTRGTGLGLAICSRLVRLMDGRIWVEKPTDGGACFIVALPAAEPPPVEVDETE